MDLPDPDVDPWSDHVAFERPLREPDALDDWPTQSPLGPAGRVQGVAQFARVATRQDTPPEAERRYRWAGLFLLTLMLSGIVVGAAGAATRWWG